MTYKEKDMDNIEKISTEGMFDWSKEQEEQVEELLSLPEEERKKVLSQIN